MDTMLGLQRNGIHKPNRVGVVQQAAMGQPLCNCSCLALLFVYLPDWSAARILPIRSLDHVRPGDNQKHNGFVAKEVPTTGGIGILQYQLHLV
jgi:hypothetical protein